MGAGGKAACRAAAPVTSDTKLGELAPRRQNGLVEHLALAYRHPGPAPLFGSGKVSHLMGDFAKGIKSFKKNMAEDDDASMDVRTSLRRACPRRGRRFRPSATVRPTTTVHSQS